MTTRLSREEIERRLDVFAQCRSDLDAARRLGLHVTSFQKWRRLNGLPGKNMPPAPLSDVEVRRRLEGWAHSVEIGDAARSLGLRKGTFEVWMRSQGLRSRRAFQAPPPSPAPKFGRYLQAYHEAASDEEAARILRIPHSAFSRWRRRNQLPGTAKAARKRFISMKAERVRKATNGDATCLEPDRIAPRLR